jgi:hypothetical protein
VAGIEMAPNMHVAGTRLGMMFVAGSIGVLIGNPIAGAILDSKSGFSGLEAFGVSFLWSVSKFQFVGFKSAICGLQAYTIQCFYLNID